MKSLASNQYGFTLLELIIVVSLVVFLFGVAAWKLLPIRGAAEKAQVLQTYGVLQNALGLHMAERAVRGQLDLEELSSENPLDWLAVKPPMARADQCFQGQPGRWQWCDGNNTLVYRLRYPQYRETPAYRGEFLRFRTMGSMSNGLLRNVRIEALDGLPSTPEFEMVKDTGVELHERNN